MVTGSLPMPINSDIQVEPAPDFVFTHSELEDVLSFMTGGVEEKPSSFGTTNFLLGSTPPASASLQFQPHLSNPYDSLALDQGLNGAQPFLTQIGNESMLAQDAAMPFDMAEHLQPGLNPQPGSKALKSAQPMIKGEPLGDMDAPGIRSPLDMSQAPSPVHASSAAMDDVTARQSTIRTRHAAQGSGASEAGPLTKAFAQLGSGLSSPPSKPRQSSAELNTSYHRKGSKQHTSHSTVEKNRRDRINSLIDELRDLVPPQSKESNSQDNLDPSKRPKHVVLSDTIQLVRVLQHKVSESEKAMKRMHSGSRAHSGSLCKDRDECMQENGAQHLLRRSLPEGTNFGSDTTTSSSGGGPSQDLPSAPKGATQSAGVVVEQSAGCMYVKVNCRDRRGLLSDVITALKSFPLEITTAAVTTTADGYVYDVFQVKAPAGQSYTQEDIQCHVHYALYPSSSRDHLGDKRQRTADED